MISSNHPGSDTQLSSFFRALGQPASIDILLAIGEGETCVCHLEAILGLRQAYISQHLMAMRDASLLATRRDGRFVFYRVADDRLLPLIDAAAAILGIDRSKPKSWPADAQSRVRMPAVHTRPKLPYRLPKWKPLPNQNWNQAGPTLEDHKIAENSHQKRNKKP